MTALDLDAIREELKLGLSPREHTVLAKELLAEITQLRTECDRLNGELIRAKHGHAPGPGMCEQYRCSSCRYCGKEKPCGCFTTNGFFYATTAPPKVSYEDGLRKDFLDEGGLISAVSTIAMFDADGYETAVGLPLGGFEGTGQWHPVERYETLEDAMEGHERWLAAAPTLTEVTDLGPPGGEPTVVDLAAELAQLKKEI